MFMFTRNLTTSLLALFVPTVAIAADLTFTGNGSASGVWNDPLNWDGAETPEAGDTATIPNGKTCNVTSANQVADSVTVDAGGKLVIPDKNLTIGTTSGATTTTINGVLEFEDGGSAGTRSELRLEANVTITGSGAIQTVVGEVGDITRQATAAVATFTGTLDLIGSLDFNIDVNLGADVQLIVNNASDSMTFGTGSFTFDLLGSGDVNVSAGSLIFDRTDLESFTGDFNLSGGEIEVQAASVASKGGANYLISGGTLDIDTTLTGNKLEFTGGTIEVANGAEANFAI